MNRKGFTLVELIAMMVVIAILMAIAVPNISGIVKKNRESIGVEDVNKMIGNAKTKMEVKKIATPGPNQCVAVTLNYLDSNNDFKTGINGGKYNKEESVVFITKEQIPHEANKYQYKYYLRIVEVDGQSVYMTQNASGQVKLIDYDDFAKSPEKYSPKKIANPEEYYMHGGGNVHVLEVAQLTNPGICSGGLLEVYN